MEWKVLAVKTLSLLSTSVSYDKIAKIARRMDDTGKLVIVNNRFFYRKGSAEAEYGAASNINRLMTTQPKQRDRSKEIDTAAKTHSVNWIPIRKWLSTLV